MFEINPQTQCVVTVYLDDIVEKLNDVSDHWEQYLNLRTGKVIALSDGVYHEVDKDAAELIESSDYFCRLPNQYDLHEYRIMETFAASISDILKNARLTQALTGKRSYYHFKNEIRYLGLDKSYYAFRDASFFEIAKKWCDDNHIPYKRRSTPHL